MSWLSRPPPPPIYGLRQVASSNRIGRDVGVSVSTQSFTMCGWVSRTGYALEYENLLSLNNIGPSRYVEMLTHFNSLVMYNDIDGFITGGPTMPVDGRWFFIAMSCSSVQTGYLSLGGYKWDTTLTSAGNVNNTANVFYFMNDKDSQPTTGEIACMRAWNRPLSSQELLREMRSPDAVAKSGLIFDLRGANRRTIGGNLTLTGAPLSGSRPLYVPTLEEFPYYFSSTQIGAVGMASETDTALSLGKVKIRADGRADEADTALSLGKVKIRADGQADETDTALSLGKVKIRADGQADETDTALSLGKVKIRAPENPVETDSALGLVVAHVRGVATASEIDSALSMSRAKVRDIALSVETDSAYAPSRAKARTVGIAAEIDQAFALAGGALIGEIGMSVEHDSAFALHRASPIANLGMDGQRHQQGIRRASGGRGITLRRSARKGLRDE